MTARSEGRKVAETKEKEKPSPRKREPDESQKVAAWRQERFYKILQNAGMEDDQIDVNVLLLLVHSASSPNDLEGLIQKGCKPETAIRILV